MDPATGRCSDSPDGDDGGNCASCHLGSFLSLNKPDPHIQEVLWIVSFSLLRLRISLPGRFTFIGQASGHDAGKESKMTFVGIHPAKHVPFGRRQSTSELSRIVRGSS